MFPDLFVIDQKKIIKLSFTWNYKDSVAGV